MSTLDDRWTDIDPDALTAAALEAPRCQCERPIRDGDECGYCGREIREPGTLGREFRQAAYDRRLRWARGAGLDPLRDFRGVHDEVGANPELPTLDAALSARGGGADTRAGRPVRGSPGAASVAYGGLTGIGTATPESLESRPGPHRSRSYTRAEKAVESLLEVYGHIDLIALSEVDALYASNVVPLRAAASDANPTQSASEPA